MKRVEGSRVDKPWGYELIWARTDRYLGKVLHVNKGEALSLQYHERKDEFQYVVAGCIDISCRYSRPALAVTSRFSVC